MYSSSSCHFGTYGELTLELRAETLINFDFLKTYILGSIIIAIIIIIIIIEKYYYSLIL